MKTSCPDCKSSDALEVYDDGHTYCYSCGTYRKSKAQRKSGQYKDIRTKIVPLKHRNISLRTARKYGYALTRQKFFFTEEGISSRAEACRYYKKGKEVAVHLRSTKVKNFKWIGNMKKAEFYGQHLFSNVTHTMWKRWLVVTEGEIDCLSVSQAFNNKRPVVSIPSGAQSAGYYFKRHLEFLMSFDYVILWFDNDTQGREAVEDIVKILPIGKVKVVTTPEGYKDANDMLREGLYKEIASCVYEAQVYRPESIVTNTSLVESLEDYKLEMGITLPYPRLNKAMYGLRTKEITTITAGTGIGKSHFASELFYHLLSKGIKVGMICLEESYQETGLRLMAIHKKVPYLDMAHRLVPNSKYISGLRFLEKAPLCVHNHFGSLDSDRLSYLLRYMAVGFGAKFILLDHISIILAGMVTHNEVKATDILTTNLRTLVENTGVGVVVISHLRKRDGGKGFERGVQIGLDDLRGSGSLKQISDNIIALERNQQAEDEEDKLSTNVRLLKCRRNGRGLGLQDTLLFDEETERLTIQGDKFYE